MTKYDEMLTRLKTAHMFFGAQAEKEGGRSAGKMSFGGLHHSGGI